MLLSRKNRVTINSIDASKQTIAQLEKQHHRTILLKSLMANKFIEIIFSKNKFMGKEMFNLINKKGNAN